MEDLVDAVGVVVLVGEALALVQGAHPAAPVQRQAERVPIMTLGDHVAQHLPAQTAALGGGAQVEVLEPLRVGLGAHRDALGHLLAD